MELVNGKIAGFVTGNELCRLTATADLWRQYRDSMTRRRPHGVFAHNAFGRYARRVAAAFIFGRPSRPSAVLGQWREGRFVVSHFCPSSQREGRGMLLALRDSGQPVVLAVTDDLAPMVARLGYNLVGTTVQPFRGRLVQKTVFTNNMTIRGGEK